MVLLFNLKFQLFPADIQENSGLIHIDFTILTYWFQQFFVKFGGFYKSIMSSENETSFIVFLSHLCTSPLSHIVLATTSVPRGCERECSHLFLVLGGTVQSLTIGCAASWTLLLVVAVCPCLQVSFTRLRKFSPFLACLEISPRMNVRFGKCFLYINWHNCVISLL